MRFPRRQPSEREIAEKKLAKSRIPELHPQPGHEGTAARYVVPHPSGRPEMDRWALGHIIRPGGKTREQEIDEEEDRILRAEEDEERQRAERYWERSLFPSREGRGTR